MREDSSAEVTPILSFAEVTTESDGAYDGPLWGVDFALCPGELLLVRLERGHLRMPLADVALGLVTAIRGVVRFQGEDWSAMSPDRAAAQRGKCGRFFADHIWCSDLTIGDSILLAQRQHTRRPEAEIEAEAANLANYFGLPGVPMTLPAQTRRGDLGRAALVRAFIGRPELILLDQPTSDLFPEIMPPLMNAVRAARDRGAAVLWITSELGVWNEKGLHANLKGTLFGSRMQVVAAAAG